MSMLNGILIFLILVVVLIVILTIVVLSLRWNDQHEKELQEWAQTVGKADVGKVIESMVSKYSDRSGEPVLVMYPCLTDALARLLDQLGPEDVALLTSYQWSILFRILRGILNQYGASQLGVAILNLIARTGRTTSLPAVKYLAEFQPVTDSEKRICAAAQECLPVLQALAAQQQNAETLLRATQTPAPAPEELLRPAGETPDTDPQQLLRASEEGQHPA